MIDGSPTKDADTAPAGVHHELSQVNLFAVRQHGDAPVSVLLVHGWGCDHTVWAPLLRAAGTDLAAATVDLRGHGRSGRARTPHTVADMADDLAEVLHGWQAPAVVVVGHSMGANVAVELGVRHPDRVAAVVAVDPAYGDPAWADAEQRVLDLEREGTAAPLRALPAAFHPDSDPALIGLVAPVLETTNPQVLIESLRSTYLDSDAFGHLDVTRRKLRMLATPLLSLYADPAAAARAVTFPIAHQVRVIDSTGHFIPLEQPSVLWNHLREVLDATSAPGRGRR